VDAVTEAIADAFGARDVRAPMQGIVFEARASG
jgi:hypothetical protein